MNNETTEARFRVRNASWLTIGLAIVTVVTLLTVSGSDMGYGGGYDYSSGPTGGMRTDGVQLENSSAPSAGMPTGNTSVMIAPDYYPIRGGGEVSATDTREFLKVYYNATMQTRDVPGLTRRVETTVRGYDGRIDRQSSSDKYGSVSFALPQSKYEAFRTELESLVGSRYLKVDVSSQNKLEEKVSIEDQQKQADANLASYEAARQALVTRHTSTVQALQAEIKRDTQDLAALRALTATPAINAQIQTLTEALVSLNKQLVNENAQYNTQLKYADANIASAQQWQKGVQTQDKQLLDSVATVTGTVSIRWISIYDMVQLYLPGYTIPGIFLLLTVLSFANDRRRMLKVVA